MKVYTPIVLAAVLLLSCNSTSQLKGNSEKSANLSFKGKSLEEIKSHVVDVRWKWLSGIGGMTGRDTLTYNNEYITFNADGTISSEGGKGKGSRTYKWAKQRDVYTGDSIYVIQTMNIWKVEGLYNDTLHMSDNYPDGYGYRLIRAKGK